MEEEVKILIIVVDTIEVVEGVMMDTIMKIIEEEAEEVKDIMETKIILKITKIIMVVA